jgi:hypothetical protein
MESEPLYSTLLFVYRKVGTGVPSLNTGGLASRVLDNKKGDGRKIVKLRPVRQVGIKIVYNYGHRGVIVAS